MTAAKPTGIAKKLRKEQTLTEGLLWKRLRAKQMAGIKFRRQEPIGTFIVDFVCHEKKLVIGLDGDQHGRNAGREKDIIRDDWLSLQGYTVLRFWNHEVFNNMDGVLKTIYDRL